MHRDHCYSTACTNKEQQRPPACRVSRTSLSDIAEAAGASRGAIYWHFKNKADLFNAMMDRTTLPMEDLGSKSGLMSGGTRWLSLQRAILDAMRKIATDERTRRVFEVATLKVEYVEELLAVKERHLQCYVKNSSQIQRSLEQTAAHLAMPLRLPPQVAAQGLHALMVGLIHTWLLARTSFAGGVASQAVTTYLVGLGLLPMPTCGASLSAK